MPCSAASHAEINRLWEQLNIPSGCNVSQSVIVVSNKFCAVGHCICCSLYKPIHITPSLEVVVIDCLGYLTEVRNPEGRAKGWLWKSPKNRIHMTCFPGKPMVILLPSVNKEGAFKFSKGSLLALYHLDSKPLDNAKVDKNWPAELVWVWEEWVGYIATRPRVPLYLGQSTWLPTNWTLGWTIVWWACKAHDGHQDPYIIYPCLPRCHQK